MARKARVISETGLYHIYLKGTCNIFPSDEDFELFKNLIEQIGDGFEVLAYGFTKLSGSLFVKTDSISVSMKKILTEYAMRFNRKYRHEGSLFVSRYKSEPVREAYAANLSRYIMKRKKYAGCSDSIRSMFSSDRDFNEFMKQPEPDTFGADRGLNSAEIRFQISEALNGKNFLELQISERAKVVKQLSSVGITHSAIARFTGVSRGTVINCLNADRAETEKRRREEIIIL